MIKEIITNLIYSELEEEFGEEECGWHINGISSDYDDLSRWIFNKIMGKILKMHTCKDCDKLIYINPDDLPLCPNCGSANVEEIGTELPF